MSSSFDFNKIIIIQSLEAHELQTGELLYQFIKKEIADLGHEIHVDFVNCTHANEFKAIIKELIKEVEKGYLPLLHIECHGDTLDGLIFQNGSELNWQEVSELFLDLNIATKFNLFVSISACYGLHFISEMTAIKPAPAWGIVAPSALVYSDELFKGFKDFYKHFLRFEMEKAILSFSNNNLSVGDWYCQTAESWFSRVVKNYITRYCSKKECRKRVESMHLEIKNKGETISMSELKKNLHDANRIYLTNKYFEIYFSTAKIPENKNRFIEVKHNLEKEMSEMRKTGLYLI